MSNEVKYQIVMTGGNPEVVGHRLTNHLAARQVGDGWAIDHIESGLWLTRVKTLADARTVAESVEPLIDWATIANKSDPENIKRAPDNVIAYLRRINGQARVPRIGEDWPKPPPVAIHINFSASISFSADELWPDRDWPDEITEADVRGLIDAEGGDVDAMREWNITPRASISITRLGVRG